MIYFFISAGIFLTDCVIKHFVEKKLEYNKSEKKFNNMIIIRKVYNKGGALNALENKQEFVAGFSAALMWSVIATQFLLIGRKKTGLLKLALSFIIGGGASNLYDRMVRKYVVDYFSFNVKIKKIKDIVFNISDLFIFTGVGIAAFYSILTDRK